MEIEMEMDDTSIEVLEDEERKNDEKISMAIMSSYAILSIQYLLIIFFNLSGTGFGGLLQMSSKLLVGLFYLYGLPSVISRNKNKFMLAYFLLVYVFIINSLFFNENSSYLKQIIFPLFFIAIPSLIYAYSINNWEVLLEVMKKTSNIVFAVGTFTSLLFILGYANTHGYSMSLSYYMLLPATVYVNELLNKLSIKNILIAGISIAIILTLGSRGAILCLGVFIILKILHTVANKTTFREVPLYLVLLTVGVFMLAFLKDIFKFAYEGLLSVGIRSRSLLLFSEGGLYLSGRNNLYSKAFNSIVENPITGTGLMSDRLLLDTYVHNILIEIIMNFGMIVGTILIALIVFFIIKALLTSNNQKYNIIIIWLSIGFIHLMVSSTYLTDFKFWIFLGLLLNVFFKSESRARDNESIP